MQGILVWEHDDDLREALVQVLSLSGYSVRAAREPAEALALIATAPPDVLLVSDGPRALPRDVDAFVGTAKRVIVLAASTQAADAAKRRGMRVLLKPFTGDDLLAQLAAD